MIEVQATMVMIDSLEPLVEELNQVPRSSIPELFMGMSNSTLSNGDEVFDFCGFKPHFCSCLAGRLNELNVRDGGWLDVDFFTFRELRVDALDSRISKSFSNKGWRFFSAEGQEYPVAKSHIL